MPDLINIDTNQKAADINVPILRQPKFMALLLAYLSPTVKLQNDISTNYLGGLSYAAWVRGATYHVGDRVTAGRSSYECIQANSNAHITITDTNYWYRVAADNIGLSERLYYNCAKMQLEYILNKRFNSGGSIYPPYNSTIRNIYITTNPGLPRIAWLGKNNAVGSWVKPQNASKFYYHTDAITGLGPKNYTIYVPSAIYSISLDMPDQIIMETNRYNAVGLKFDIQSY
jgi:hypothetical protein